MTTDEAQEGITPSYEHIHLTPDELAQLSPDELLQACLDYRSLVQVIVGILTAAQETLTLRIVAAALVYQQAQQQRSPYVFPSQRSSRLSEAGLHHWFRALKQQATPEESEQISDISFHDLRHDFAHRVLEAGWTLEEIAYYLGHVTLKGTPALQTTVKYTQVARAQVKEKLKTVKG